LVTLGLFGASLGLGITERIWVANIGLCLCVAFIFINPLLRIAKRIEELKDAD